MRNPCEAGPSLTLYVPVYIQVAGLSFANLYQLDYATLENAREKVTQLLKKIGTLAESSAKSNETFE